jgi:hypothetical protein
MVLLVGGIFSVEQYSDSHRPVRVQKRKTQAAAVKRSFVFPEGGFRCRCALELGAESESQGRIADFPYKSSVIADFAPAILDNPAELGPCKLKWVSESQLRAMCGSAGASMAVCKSTTAKKAHF